LGDLYDPDISREDWVAYSLKNILIAYDIPSKVGFAVQQPTEPTSEPNLIAYSFVIHYEEPNVTYFYRGSPIFPGKYFKICPMDLNESATAIFLFMGKHPYRDFSNWVD